METSRSAARLAGDTKYFTGKPCKHGHIDFRYTASGTCQKCKARITAKWAADKLDDHRERSRQYNRKRKGMPLPPREEPAACECCGKTRAPARLCLDHDHSTNAFRGWLCGPCNTGIGMLGDTQEGLLRAMAYLKRVEESL